MNLNTVQEWEEDPNVDLRVSERSIDRVCRKVKVYKSSSRRHEVDDEALFF